MAFENKYFSDGETTFAPPSWRKSLEEISRGVKPTSLQDNQKKRSYQEDEVGLRHPKNGSFVRIDDDGSIEAFTGYGTGLRIKSDHTIQLFGDKIQLIGREMNINASPNGSTINGIGVQQHYPSYPKTKGVPFEVLNEMKISGRETYAAEEWKV